MNRQIAVRSVHSLGCEAAPPYRGTHMCKTLMQGVSTTLYAATAPELKGKDGAY